MKDLYIVGAGGFGREVYGWLLDGDDTSDCQFQGFLDDNPEALKGLDYEKGVVAPVQGFRVKPSHLFVCGIGEVSTKIKLCKPLLKQGASFLTVVHPTVVTGKNVRLGQGIVLCPGVVLTCDIEVGDMTMINCCSSVGHDATIGDWCTISAHCDLTGHTKLGSGVFMGSGSRVIPGKSVGDGAVVGAGSVVIQSVAAEHKVFGNPARVFAG
jgi:sugar O-acyltransferase (sialic acid O-acetyltransferase NeuD family)